MGCASSSNANDCKRRDKNICKREDDSSLICNAAIREGDLIINVCNSYDRKRIEDSFEADWKSDEKYPSGGSAVIMPYKHKKSGCVFAFKKLKPKSKITNIISEFKILRSLDHPNIIRPLGNYGSDNLLLEYCHGGDLFNRLKSQHFLSEASARSYVYTLCYVLKYLHSNKILHGDLKLENIMMEDSLLTSDIKLIDFGFALRFEKGETFSHIAGTPYYCAPEVHQREYTDKCDIWALGDIVFMLLSGEPPFAGSTTAEVYENAAKRNWKWKERYPIISNHALDFISLCFEPEESRPSADMLLQHIWLQRCHNQAQISEGFVRKAYVSMEEFSFQPMLCRLFMEIVAFTLKSNQVKQLRKLFYVLDESKTAAVDLATYCNFFTKNKVCTSANQLNHTFQSLDYDNKGSLTYHKFLAGGMGIATITESNLVMAFENLSQGASYFGINDIVRLFGTAIPLPMIEKSFQEMKFDTSTKFTYKKFKNILCPDHNASDESIGFNGTVSIYSDGGETNLSAPSLFSP